MSVANVLAQPTPKKPRTSPRAGWLTTLFISSGVFVTSSVAELGFAPSVAAQETQQVGARGITPRPALSREDVLGKRLFAASATRSFVKEPQNFRMLVQAIYNPHQSLDIIEKNVQSKRDGLEKGPNAALNYSLSVGADLGPVNASISHTGAMPLTQEEWDNFEKKAAGTFGDNRTIKHNIGSGRSGFAVVAEALAEAKYNEEHKLPLSPGQRALLEVYNHINSSNDAGGKLPLSTNPKVQIQTAADIKNDLLAAGISEKDANDIINGIPLSEENRKKVSEVLTKKIPSSARDDAETNKPPSTEDEKKLRLENLRQRVETMHSYGMMADSIGELTGSEDMRRAAKAFNAGLSIYSAAASMAIAGALDPTGISAIAGGLSILNSMMTPQGPSADEIMIGMLSQILEQQKKILEDLRKLDVKIDLLDQKLDILTDMVVQLQQFNQDAFNKNYDALVEGQITRDNLSREDLANIEANIIGHRSRAKLATLTETGGNPNYATCLTINQNKGKDTKKPPAKCTPEAERFFADFSISAKEFLASFAYGQLAGAPYVRLRDIATTPAAALKANGDTSVEMRVGELESAARIVNAFVPQSLATKGRMVNVERVSGLANPYYLMHVYGTLYVDMVGHFPKHEIWQATVNDLNRVAGEVDKLDQASAEARGHVQEEIAAMMASAFNALKASQVRLDAVTAGLLTIGETGLKDADMAGTFNARLQDIDALPTNTDIADWVAVSKSTAVSGKELLFPLLTDQELDAKIRKLSPDQLEKLAVTMGLGRIDNRAIAGSLPPWKTGRRPIRQPVDGDCTPTYMDGNQVYTLQRVLVPADVTVQLPGLIVSQARQDHHVKQSDHCGAKSNFEDAPNPNIAALPNVAQPNEQTAWQNYLITKIMQRRTDAANRFNASVNAIKDNGWEDAYQTFAKSKYAANLLLEVGFGDGLRYSPKLQALRDIQKSAAAIETELNAIRDAKDLASAFRAEKNLAAQLKKMAESKKQLPADVPTEDETVEFGFRGTKEFKSYIDSTRSYLQKRLHQDGPRP